MIPTSRYTVVDTPERRIEVLRTLGYELQDLGMASAWVILEESSAESLLGWLIAWFVPELATVRTVVSRGTGRVKEVFSNLREMLLYAHLESQYRGRAWVLVDGDDSGRKVVSELRANFVTWNESHFHHWSESDLERFYPPRFSEDVDRVLALKADQKWEQKRLLTGQVQSWIVENAEAAKEEFEISAAEVIVKLQSIASALRIDPANIQLLS
jgi:hypothetical protein